MKRRVFEMNPGAQRPTSSGLHGSAFDEKRQRVITSAREVFMKYGFNRVTMNDLADAAKMSRPALYLIFSKKEEIFRAVILQMVHEVSDGVRQELPAIKAPVDKLKFVFEAWMVRTFDWSNQSNEAKEIYEGSHEFAQGEAAEGMRLFERDVASMIELLPKSAVARNISTKEAAHVLASAVAGFKRVCKTSSELRQMIHALIELTVRT